MYQGRVVGFGVTDQTGLALPLKWECFRSVEVHASRCSGFRNHPDLPVLFKHERIGQVMRLLQNWTWGGGTISAYFADRNAPAPGRIGIFLDEQKGPVPPMEH